MNSGRKTKKAPTVICKPHVDSVVPFRKLSFSGNLRGKFWQKGNFYKATGNFKNQNCLFFFNWPSFQAAAGKKGLK